MKDVLIIRNKPANGVRYTKIVPYDEKLEEQLRKNRIYSQTITHNSDFDYQKFLLAL